MSNKTRIIVLKSKELIYTGIFVALGILLIFLLLYMFSPKDENPENNDNTAIGTDTDASASSDTDSVSVGNMNGSSDLQEDVSTQDSAEADTVQETTEADTVQQASVTYEPGIYTSTMNLGGSNLAVTVTVDADRISHVDIANIDETITAMYPLLSPTLDEINAQISSVSSIDEITCSSDNEYTSIIICDAIKRALEE